MGIENFYADNVFIKRPANTPSATGAQTVGYDVVQSNVSCRIRILSDEERSSRGVMAEVSTHLMICPKDTIIDLRDQVSYTGDDETDPYFRVVTKPIEKRTAKEVHHIECDLFKVVV